MADADLEEIRRARLQQLRQQQGSPGAVGGGEGSQEDANRQREADARQLLLSQILTPAASDRLGRIRLVKASRATSIEDRLIALARSGQLRSKVTEEQLKELLGAVAEQQEKQEEKIVVSRRKGGGWDSDDGLDELMAEV
ncbi:DNA-binding TFAR19-related protein [Lepidopterella palustris CBS 459.81]|uniref:DNA-binding TFAR19-related protein n=1 Tax=Lepidopterella palustris CBS 459.81 TaxID=1314670 RepID=A0A8E2E8U8_9PEZI|nr:DNA-binding TFAR19-related protein [Lepidopterella palustris CBS 459.81]